MTKVHHSSKNQPEMNKPRDYQSIQQYSEESGSNSHYIPEQSFAMDNSNTLHVGGTDAVISGSYYINSNNTYTQQVAPIYQPIRTFSNNGSNNNGRGSLMHNPSIATTDGTMQNALPSISNKALGENRNHVKESGADTASLDTTLSRSMKQEPSLTATPIPSGSSSCDGSSGHGDCVSPIGSLSDLTNPTLAAVETEMSDSTLNEFINNEIFEGISLPDNLGQFDVNNVEMDYGMIEENSSKTNLIPNSPNSINLVNEAKGPTTSRKRQKSGSTMQGEVQKKIMLISHDMLIQKPQENSSEPSQSKHRHKHRSKQKRREKVKSHGLSHVGNTASQIPKATADPRSSLVQQPQSSSLLKNDSKEPIKPKTSQKEKVQTEDTVAIVKDQEYLSLVCLNERATSVSMTETGMHPLGGVKRWQTVTAVQAPKLPPILSDQDRIPKRGRPSKQMTEINLKLKKAQASTSQVVVAPVVKPPVVPVATVSSLVSTYTITDSGAIQKLSIKHKENKRNKERAEAFRNMLSEISKRTSTENKTSGAGDVVAVLAKPGVRTRNQASSKKSEDTSSEAKPKPRTKGKGHKKPRVVSEEDVYNFTELAKRYNISNSILFRHLEHTQKLNSIDVTPKLEMAKKQKQPSRSSSSKALPLENKSLPMIKPAEKVAAPSAVNRSSVRGSITLHDKALHGSNIKLKLPSSSSAEAEPPTNTVKPRTLNGTTEKNPEVSKGPKEVSQPDTLAVAPCTSKQATSQETEKVSKKKSKKSKKKKKHKVKHSKHDKERSKKKDKKKKSKHKHSSKVKNQNSNDQQASSSKETSKQQKKLEKQNNSATSEQNTVVANVSASSYASNSSNEEHQVMGQTQAVANPELRDYRVVEVFQDEISLKCNLISAPSSAPPVFGSNMSASGVMPTFRGIKEHGGIINVGQTSDFNISPALNFAGNDSIERLGTDQSSLKKHKYKRKKVLRRSKNTIDPKFLDQMDKLATLFNSAHIEAMRNHFSETSTAKGGANFQQIRSPSKLFTSHDCASENNKLQSSNGFQKQKLSNLSVFCYEPFFQNHGFVKVQQNHNKRQQVNDKAKPVASLESNHQKASKPKPTRAKIRSPVVQSTISLSENTSDQPTSPEQNRPTCSSEDVVEKSTPVSKHEASNVTSGSSSSCQSSEESAAPVDMELLNHIKAAFTKSLNASASVPCEVVDKTFDNAIKTYLQSCSTKNNTALAENAHLDYSSPPPAKRSRGSRSKKISTTPASSAVAGPNSPTHTKSATVESNKRTVKSSKSTTSSVPATSREAQNSSHGKRGPGRPRKRGHKDSNQQDGSSAEEFTPAPNTPLSLKQPDSSDSNHSPPPSQQPHLKTGKKQSLESVVNKLKNKEGLKETVKSSPPEAQKAVLTKTKKNTKHVDKSSKLDGSASNDIQCNQNQMNSYDCWSSPNIGDSSCFMNPSSSLPKKTNLILSGLLHHQKGDEKCKENTSGNPNKSVPSQPLIPNTYTDDVMSMQCEFQIPYDLWLMLYNKKLPSVNQNVMKRFREIRKNVVYDPCTCSSFPCNCSYIQDKNVNEVADSNFSCRRLPDKTKNAAVKRFKSYEKGWGLQTRQDLRKGQFVIEYVGEVLPLKRFQTRLAESYMAAACGRSYCAHLDQNTVIDQHVMANASRYINHSCDPSCELERRPAGRHQQERLCVVAKHDMTSGVEITIDYNKYMYDYCQTENCRCNSAKCRKMFGGVKIRDYNTSQFIEHSNKSINILHEKAGFCAETLKNHPAGTLHNVLPMVKEMPILSTDERKVIIDGRVLLIRNLLKATSNNSTGQSSVGSKTFAKKRGGQQSYEMVNDVIRCICRIDREEGTMIQCERCNVWQHCQCMQVDPDRYEEAVYLCELCVDTEPTSSTTTKKTSSRSSKRSSTASKKVTRTSHNCRIREIELVPQPPNAPPGHKYFLSLLKEGLCVKEGDCMRVVHDHRLRRDASSSSYNPPTRSSSRIQSYNSSASERTNFIVVEKLWTDESGDKFAYGYHLIRPQDTIHDDDESFYPNELFATPFYEIVPLEAVLGHCYILTPSQYRKGKPKGGKLDEIFVCERLVDSSLQTTNQVYQTPPITDQFVTYRKPLTTFFRDQQVPDHFRKSVNNRAQWLKAMEQRQITSKDQADSDGVVSNYPHSFLSTPSKHNLPSNHRTSENVFKTKRLSGIVNKLTETASARRKRKT